MLPLVALTPETRHLKVLAEKQHIPGHLQSGSNGEDLAVIEKAVHNPDAHLSLRVVLWRPTVLLFTEPLVFVATALSSFSMGLIYLFTEALSTVYTSPGFDFSYESIPALSGHVDGHLLQHLHTCP